MGGSWSAEEPQHLHVLVVGTGMQQLLSLALELGRWPEVSEAQFSEERRIELFNRQTTLSLIALPPSAKHEWPHHYGTSDAIVYVLDETDISALTGFREVMAGALTVKPVIVALTRAGSRGVLAKHLNEADDQVTARRVVYLDPATGSGLEDIYTAICGRSPVKERTSTMADARDAREVAPTQPVTG
eukprot:CAMPEP_0178451738 /NCGR_PEP_ID=MMETSP0689_2-20121128/43854_1 /TAXON_ID=160604 /ORGANISM="Amphidinium massartii, Strain CS-259" /LENGTH=186 /DNA_ID=CAMNT_0020077363 /DNA_START=139 /DNA_END=696 /DNA_ORIENTATION=-